MSKEKQIEVDKIQRIAADEIISLDRQYYGVEPDRALAKMEAYQVAEKLYEAGYRKQIEGEWVRKDGFLVCSNCDSTKPFAVIRDEIHYFGCNYCKKCGAKMKGADDEQN